MSNYKICEISYNTGKNLSNQEKWKDIIFLCRRCNLITKDIKNIELHLEKCTVENIVDNSIEDIIKEKQLMTNKLTQIQTKIRKKDVTIMNLQLRLQYEKMKNKIYENIIQSQTDIDFENIIKENTDEVHIFNFENGKIPVVVHDFIENSKKYIIETPKQTKIKSAVMDENPELFIDEDENDNNTKPERIQKEKQENKKKTYRTVKQYITTSEKEFDNKLKEDVVRVDKKIDKIVYENFDVSHKEITESLEKLFETVINSRIYTVSLASIRQKRKKLLGKLSLTDYTELVNEHNKRLESIFESRNYSKKKINKIVLSSLTPLDMRLTYYSGYTNVNIEVDEVQKFGLALEILIEHEKQFVPYNKDIFFNNIKNYSISLFELRECIERCLVNRYGFQNVIYIPRPNSTSSDPFSFYTLVENAGEIRKWKMVCRLEDFSIDFADTVLPYCITLFRKIYKDVFNDNIYREDYMSKSQITEFDCEQLIQNIIIISQPKLLCKMFQDIIKTKCTISPTEFDKFDLYGDDKFQQKRFTNTKDTHNDIFQVIKRLFDGIDNENANHIINSR